jgi:hypothetical protein
MDDLTVTPGLESGARAFSMAELAPQDIDVVQLCDAFTINTILFLEDLGFCAKARAGASSRTVPSRPAACCRSTPTAAVCPACIRTCTARSPSSKRCASCAANAASAR